MTGIGNVQCGPRPLSTPDGVIEAFGCGQGAPTIVLEAGLGDDWQSWQPLLPALPPDMRCFAYSRPGYGGSTDAAASRDPMTQAHELRGLLALAGETPPFLLVGHSLGGWIAQCFARAFPADTAGLVLLDPPHPAQIGWLLTARAATARLFREAMGELTNTARAEQAAHHRAAASLHAEPSEPFAGPVRYLSASATAFGSARYRARRAAWARAAAARYDQVAFSRVACGHYIHHECPDAVLEAIESIRRALGCGAGGICDVR